MVICPNCGEIPKENVELYRPELQKQQIRILPILPVCGMCRGEVKIAHTCRGGEIIVLNGTCGSGKTTIAEILQAEGFLAIDGDCAIQSLRHKKGTKQYAWEELTGEIACEIDILSLFGQRIVLSHVVLPEDMDRYRQMFRSRNLRFKMVLLRPAYEAAVERCETRTCHTSVTPEKWIRHFYDVLAFEDPCVDIVDNTRITARETAQIILELPYKGEQNR